LLAAVPRERRRCQPARRFRRGGRWSALPHEGQRSKAQVLGLEPGDTRLQLLDGGLDLGSFASASGRERSVAVRPRLTVNTAQAATDAAVAGLGLVRVISYQVNQLVADKKLRIVFPSSESEPMPVHLVHLPGTQSRPAAAFIEFAAERLRKRIA
jgi:DNA-binding transcriptional LysR family regulator